MIILKKGVFTFLLIDSHNGPSGRKDAHTDAQTDTDGWRRRRRLGAAGPNGASDGPNGAPAQQNWTPDDPNDVKTKYFILICCVFSRGEGWGGALFSLYSLCFRIVFVIFGLCSFCFRMIIALFSDCFRFVFGLCSLRFHCFREQPGGGQKLCTEESSKAH